VVFNDGGVHLYAQPASAQTQAPLLPASAQTQAPLLPWNTTLTVDAYLPPDAAHRDQAGWRHVTTPGGQHGYVNSGYLDYDLPDPQAKLLKIQAHDTAEIIVKKAGYRFAHGRDARYYVNVLVSVNKPGTLSNHDPHPEQVDHWKKTVAVVNETIWLPGQAFADLLTGVVGSGSITGGAWAALQQGLGWAEVHVLQTAALANQALGIVGDAATNAAHYALTSGGRVIARIPRAVGPAAMAALQAVATLGTQPAALIVALGKAVAGAALHQLPPPLVALLEQKAQNIIMGVLGPDVRRVLGDARATLALILANPMAVLTHLGEALARGFGQFRDHLWPDLQSGVVTWLARQLGLDAPDGTGFTLDATGLLSLGLDALGLTYAAFRHRVVDRLTAEKVGQADLLVRAVEAGVQGAPALLTTLKRQGLAATWRTLLARVGASVDSLLPAALGTVRDWVAQRLVQQGIVKLVALCNPVGDVIEALLAAYNALQFVADNLRHIGQLVETLSGALGRIARGDTGPAGDTIYAALPAHLDGFLALTPRMTMLHVSDTPLPAVNHHLPVGLGSIGLTAYCAALLARGFHGPAILEIGGLPQSGGFGRDTDEALIDSRRQFQASIDAASRAADAAPRQ